MSLTISSFAKARRQGRSGSKLDTPALLLAIAAAGLLLSSFLLGRQFAPDYADAEWPVAASSVAEPASTAGVEACATGAAAIARESGSPVGGVAGCAMRGHD